ncbi:MAG: hypothetical protein ACR2OW_15600 [Methyloligellaceae bacterium]
MLLSIPFLIIPVIIYNGIAFFSSNVDESMASAVLPTMTLVSGGQWTLTLGDLILLLALALLFVEILKSTRVGAISLLDHILSTVLFVICLVEFLVVEQAATSVFFLLTTMTLIDMVAGFSVTMRAARRDIGFAPPG